jgi:hypothetical protein
MFRDSNACAKELLGIIARIGPHSGKLTYRSAAKMMGVDDYEKHSRAVAQMGSYLIVDILPNSDQVRRTYKANENLVRDCSSCSSRGQRF